MWLVASVMDSMSLSLTPISLLPLSLNSLQALAVILPEIALSRSHITFTTAQSNGQILSPHVTRTNCNLQHCWALPSPWNTSFLWPLRLRTLQGPPTSLAVASSAPALWLVPTRLTSLILWTVGSPGLRPCTSLSFILTPSLGAHLVSWHETSYTQMTPKSASLALTATQSTILTPTTLPDFTIWMSNKLLELNLT